MNDVAKVAYLGPPGTYSEEAAVALYGNFEHIPCESLTQAINFAENNDSAIALLPIENSSEGAVRETHRLLLSTPASIISEISIPVQHCLLAREKLVLEDIQAVYGHPQALGQCWGWLKENLPRAKQIPAESNSAAAEEVAALHDSAAIASKRAAKLYELEIVATKIQDFKENETRFIAVGMHKVPPSGNDKTSLIAVMKDKPGALYELLGVIARADISMTRLESQPYKNGQYAFYIDLIGHEDQPTIRAALNEMKEHTQYFKIFGSYPQMKEQKNGRL